MHISEEEQQEVPEPQTEDIQTESGENIQSLSPNTGVTSVLADVMVESTESESNEEILEPSAAQSQIPTEVESESLALIPFKPLQVYYVEHADDLNERDEMQKLKDRIEELEFQNQNLDYLCWVKQLSNDKFKEVIEKNMDERKIREAKLKYLQEQFGLLTEEYVKLSNKYDAWKHEKRMAKEDVDTSYEEFVAEPEKGDKTEVSETS